MRKAILSFVLLLTACSNHADAPSQPSQPMQADKDKSMETIYGATFSNNQNSTQGRFLVTSNGCTKADDFRVNLKGQSIEIVRINTDRCRAMAHHIWVALEVPEAIATDSFHINNPFETPRFRIVSP